MHIIVSMAFMDSEGEVYTGKAIIHPVALQTVSADELYEKCRTSAEANLGKKLRVPTEDEMLAMQYDPGDDPPAVSNYN